MAKSLVPTRLNRTGSMVRHEFMLGFAMAALVFGHKVLAIILAFIACLMIVYQRMQRM